MERGDRGQLFVLAALALAVMIVGVALLLNSGVYSANLAAQHDATGVEEPREFLREAEIGANRVMAHSNYNNFSSYGDLRRNFTVGVHNWSDRAHHHKALGGTGVEVRELNVTNGTRVTQDTDDRQFLNNGRAPNWTVATRLGGVRQFRMNVTTATLPNVSSVQTQSEYRNSVYFRINVTPDGGTTKRIYVYGNSTQEAALVRVAGGPSGLSPPCKAPANENDRVTLHISDGLIGQGHCEALDFLHDPATPFAINYTNSHNIDGSYELFFDKTFSNAQNGNYGTDPNSDPPGLQRAIYNATLDVNYTNEQAQIDGNRTASPDRRRFIEAGQAFTFSIPVGDNVTFKRSGGEVRVLNKAGASTIYSVTGSTVAIGPTAVDVNGGELDTPYSSNNNRLKTLPGDNVVTSEATSQDSTLGVGFWKGGGASIFYATRSGGGGPSSDNEIRQVNGTAASPNDEVVFTDNTNGTLAVAGIANVSTDPGDELVYMNDSDNILYRDNGSSFRMIGGGSITYPDSPPIGTPADFNDNGTARVPFVDSTNTLLVANRNGATTALPTGTDTPIRAPMATLDWDADGELDIIFINDSASSHLKVMYNVTGTNTVRPVNDTSGSPITVGDPALGVR